MEGKVCGDAEYVSNWAVYAINLLLITDSFFEYEWLELFTIKCIQKWYCVINADCYILPFKRVKKIITIRLMLIYIGCVNYEISIN